MKPLIFIYLFLYLPTWAHAEDCCNLLNPQDTIRKLKLNAFECAEIKLANCQYQQCLGKLTNYSRPVLIAIPEQAESLRIHFHGHHLDIFPEYEKNLPSMLKAFQLEDKICHGKEMIVFPESQGKCASYDQELKDPTQIKQFIQSLQATTGTDIEKLSLHLSAHSGGGRTLKRFLQTIPKIDHITVYDAIYSDEERLELEKWHKNESGNLKLVNSFNSSPDKYTKKLLTSLMLPRLKSESVLNNQTIYKMDTYNRLSVYTNNNNHMLNNKIHYQILTDNWP